MERTTYIRMFVIGMALLAFQSYAANGIGTSSIALNVSSVSLHPGSNVLVAYTVKLASGSTWGTTISASNASALASDGINLSFSKSYADPTYSGTLTVAASSSATPGKYTASIVATGDDPSTAPVLFSINVLSTKSPSNTTTTANTTTTKTTTTNTTTTNTTSHNTTTITPSLTVFPVVQKGSIIINASTGANISLGNGNGVEIRPGTYALVDNVLESQYNFSVVFFDVPTSLSVPQNMSGYTPTGAYAFAVNGLITPTISFVNSSRAPDPIITVLRLPNSSATTTWTYLGGNYNGTAYVGGKYAIANKWEYPNSTTLVNNEFYKPVVWVFLTRTAALSAPTATSPQPSNTTSTTPPPSSSSSNLGLVIAIIVVIVIVAALLYFFSKKKG
jgi:hypothetical protein